MNVKKNTFLAGSGSEKLGSALKRMIIEHLGQGQTRWEKIAAGKPRGDALFDDTHVAGLDTKAYVSMDYGDSTTLNCKYDTFDQMDEKLAAAKAKVAASFNTKPGSK